MLAHLLRSSSCSASSLRAAPALRKLAGPAAGLAAVAAQHHDDTVPTKKELRKQIKQDLKDLLDAQTEAESRAMSNRLLASPLFQHARRVGLYVPCGKLREVDAQPLLDAALQSSSHRVYVPHVQDKSSNMTFLHLDRAEDLEPVEPFGIREPKPEYSDGRPREDVLTMDEPLDLLILTGLGFDTAGHRLGRGGGYYDHFIQRLKERAQERDWPRTLLVALAYETQMVDDVPVTEHDMDIDIVVTASKSYCCSAWGRAALGCHAVELPSIPPASFQH